MDAMPLAKLQTSVPVKDKEALLTKLSQAVAVATGKPEAYVMVTLDHGEILMAGKPGPAAYLDVRGIGGWTPKVNASLSASVCDVLQQMLGIPPERVYITFTDVAATHWGWNRKTFG
jgi:phenylpyruvate tautomerase